MNKYITSALLLVAGTTLSNAAITAVSFTGKDAASLDDASLFSSVSISGVATGTYTSKPAFDKNGTWTDTTAYGYNESASLWYVDANVTQAGGSFAAGTNIPWRLTLSLTLAQDIEVENLGISVVYTPTYAAGVVNSSAGREIGVNFDLSNTNGSVLSYDTTDTSAKTGETTTSSSLSDTTTLSAGTYTLNVYGFGKSVNLGNAGIGLKSVSITGTVSSIPEPSAFGLLAGAGALALVAARRRRRAK